MGLLLCHTTRGRITALLVAAILFIALSYNLNLPFTTSTQELNTYDVVTSVEGSRRNNAAERRNILKKSLKKKVFPGAVIIGARKAGTRALLDMLKSHPSVAAAASEVHFFDRDQNFDRGVNWYVEQMPYSFDHQVTIEKSPSYFISELAPQRIASISPQIKLILIVRDPVDRALSDYTQLMAKKGKEWHSFKEEVFSSPSGEINTSSSPIYVSMYDIHFARWLKHFGLDQILIVDGDALIKEPVAELKKVEVFLGVTDYFTNDLFYFNATKRFYCWKKSNRTGEEVPFCLGSGKGRLHQKLSNRTTSSLQHFFEPHNKLFFNQIEHSFVWGSQTNH